jgi:DNA-binding transcriptional MerR regulator
MTSLSTGAFARASGLTVKALRLYDERGLLVPAAVDELTGYRSYDLDQLPRARAVRVLRTLDLPLDEIASLLADPAPDAVEALADRLRRRAAAQERVLTYLPRLLDFAAAPDVAVELVRLPELQVLSRRTAVAIDDLSDFIGSSLTELFAQVGDDVAGPPFTRYWHPVDEERDGEVEVCVPVAAGGAPLPGGPAAVATAEGDDADYPGVLAVFEAVARAAVAGGHELDGPPREVYLSSPGDAVTRTRVEWPVR